MEFRDIISNIWPTIEFEVELEKEEAITFLDMVIKRDTHNKITYEFHQKPTHSNTYLHYTAHCNLLVKINIIKTEASTIVNNCHIRDTIWGHLEKLKADLMNSGYPEHIINIYILKGINTKKGRGERRKNLITY